MDATTAVATAAAAAVLLSTNASSVISTTPAGSSHDDVTDEILEGVPSEVALFFSGYRVRSEIWAVPLVVFGAIEMFLVAAFEAYVIVRVVAGRAPYRNFYLNQVQLLGNFLMSAVALFYASDMNPMYCVVVRFGTGMSYTLVFAAMLVKSVFYLSAQNGVYLPSSYQALLLLFTLLPQVILGIQWLVLKPPSLVKMAAMSEAHQHPTTAAALTTTIPPLFMSSASSTLSTPLLATTTASSLDVLTAKGLVCGTSYRESVLALVYVMFLLAFVAAVSLRAKALREAQGDQWWLGVTVAMSILLWLTWVLTGAAFTNRHRDGCMGFGLITISATVLVLTAFPQGARLARAGSGRHSSPHHTTNGRSGGHRCNDSGGCDCDEVVSIQWDEESSASSLYSPSFFHYKPPAPKSMASDSLDRGNGAHNGGAQLPPPKGRFTPDQKMDFVVPMKVKMPDGSTKRLVELSANNRLLQHHQQHRHHVHKPSKRSRYPSTDNPEVFYLKGGIWSAPMMY